MTTVLVFGTFDLLHEGHRSFLSQAKSRGTRLVVVVGRDSNVSRIKGQSPVEDEATRLRRVKQLGLADRVILGRQDFDYRKIIDEIGPGLICLGYDQASRGVETCGVSTTRLVPYCEKQFKSSIIRSSGV